MELLSSYVEFSSSPTGRDKSLRLLQYTSKLIGHVVQSEYNNEELYKRIKQMQGLLSSCRKTFRLGKTVDMLHGVIQGFNSIEDVQEKTLIVSSRLSYAIFYIYDMIEWTIKAGMYNGDLNYYSERSLRCWFWALVFLILRDMYEVQKLKKQYKSFKELFQKHPQIMLDLLKNLGDLFMCMSQRKFVEFSEGTEALCGITSSAIGILQTVYPRFKL